MAEVVFRSTHPDVLSVLADYRQAMDVWRGRSAALLVDLGFEGRDFLVAYGLGSRWITGIEPLPGEEPPTGWRIAHRSDQDVLVPDKRRKAGKDADARIQQTQPPADVRGHLPGMPGTQWAGSTIYTPALCEIDGAVWVRWREDVSRVDEALWERVPLSQYWAAREAQDAKAVTSGE